MLFPQVYSIFLAGSFKFSFVSAHPSAHFIVYHAILDCLSSTESPILSIWFCMYSVCSFKYMRANSFWAFLSFRALVLVGFFLLHLEAIFTSAQFSLTANVSHGTLDFVLCLVGMNSAAASKWALTKILIFFIWSIIWRLQVQSSLQASNNTGILNTCTQLWLTESEQATPPWIQ